MKKMIQQIFQSELNESIQSIQQIVGLGTVNEVFDVKGTKGNYIIRLNDEAAKKIEYQKENWCINKVSNIGIPSPQVLSIGVWKDTSFMIQNKVEGQNGKLCSKAEQLKIWEDLGRYVAIFHQVNRIEVAAVEQSEFHENWQARLRYNLKELNENDSLLHKNILTLSQQFEIKNALSALENKTFQVGLVHGDLCPRNVIWNKGTTYLLDWGTAAINVVPHNEIGILLMSKEASITAFQAFIKGLGISNLAYKTMEKDIHLLNLLHCLDKYRWAESYDVDNIYEYGSKVTLTFGEVLNQNQ